MAPSGAPRPSTPADDWLAFPLIGDPEAMAMAVVDARTGEILRTITVEDLTDVEPDASPGWTSRLTCSGAMSC